MFYAVVGLLLLFLFMVLPLGVSAALAAYLVLATVMTQTGGSMLRRTFVTFSESIDSVLFALLGSALSYWVIGQCAETLSAPGVIMLFPLICLLTQVLVFHLTLGIRPAGGMVLSLGLSATGWLVLMVCNRAIPTSAHLLLSAGY